GPALLRGRIAGARGEPRRARDPDRARPRRDRGAGDRDRARHSDQLRRQQALDLSAEALRRFRRLLLIAAASSAVLLPAAAHAQTGTEPVVHGRGNLVQPPFIPAPEPARLSDARAQQLFLADPKIRDWLKRYPTRGRVVQGEYEGDHGAWHVRVWWGDAGQIADGRVDDKTGAVTEAWTGPQVAWKGGRGGSGAFGGREINKPLVWIGFCLLFLLALADPPPPLSP